MELFGLDIRRKSTGLTLLYNQIDSIVGQDKLSLSKETVRDTVAHALNRMIKNENYFSVCTIDALVKISYITIPSERYNFYRGIHCMHWNEMLPEFRAKVLAFIFDDFRKILTDEINGTTVVEGNIVEG
jgi:hypothetical protein